MKFVEFYNKFTEFVKTFGEGLVDLSIERSKEDSNNVKVKLKVDLDKVELEEKETVEVIVQNDDGEPEEVKQIVLEDTKEEEEVTNSPEEKQMLFDALADSLLEESTKEEIKAEEKPSKSWVDQVDMKALEEINKKYNSTEEKEPEKKEYKEETLYKNQHITEDQIYIIKAYLNREVTGPVAADTLGMKIKDFYNLVQKYKRIHNIKSSKSEKKAPKEVNKIINNTKKSTPPKTNYIDWDYVYTEVKRGNTLRNLAQEYNQNLSTFTRMFNKFIKDNNYEPIGTAVKRNLPETNKVKNSKDDSITTTTTVEESVAAREKAISQIGQKVDLPNGWQSVEGVFHLVKDGVIIR